MQSRGRGCSVGAPQSLARNVPGITLVPEQGMRLEWSSSGHGGARTVVPLTPRSRSLEHLQVKLEAQQGGGGTALGGTESSAVVNITGPESC